LDSKPAVTALSFFLGSAIVLHLPFFIFGAFAMGVASKSQ
jgi:hypothetical protein